jgi:hypothetical protein
MSPCFLTIFVLIAEHTKGERSSKWRKRINPVREEGDAPTFSRRK